MYKQISVLTFVLFSFSLCSQHVIDTTSLRLNLDKAESFDLPDEKDSTAHYYGKIIRNLQELNRNIGSENINRNQKLRLYTIIKKSDFFFNTYGLYNEALASVLLAYDFVEESDSDENVLILSRIGAAYLKVGKWDLSEKYFQLTLEILEKAEERDYAKIARNYNNFAVFYANNNNIDLAVSYWRKGLNLLEQELGKDSRHANTINSNLGETAFRRSDFETALVFFRKSLRINSKHNNKNGIANSYNNIGRVHLFKGEYSKALGVFQKAEKLFVDLYTKIHPYTSSVYDGIGDCLLGLEKYEEASIAFEQSLVGKLSAFGKIHPKIAESYLSLAKIEHEKKDFQAELTYIDSAFYALGITNLDTMNVNSSGLFSLFFIATDIRLKSMLMLSNKTENLEKIGCVCSDAMRLYDDFRTSMDTESGTEVVFNQMIEIYQSCISANIALFNHNHSEKNYNQALFFSERSKFEKLLDRINIPEILKNENLLKNLVHLEDSLKSNISALKQKLTTTNKIIDDKERIVIEDELFEEYKNLQTVIDQIKVRHPEFFSVRYNNEFSDIDDIRDYIPDGETALLEYFINKEKIDIFIITKNDLEVIEIPLVSDLENRIGQLRIGVYSHHLDPSRNAVQEDYLDTLFINSVFLYENLFKPIEECLDLPEKLIIIPDGVLGYIPFELLLKEQPEEQASFHKHKYLIKDYQISYGYSATLLSEIKKKGPSTNSKNFIAFAPKFLAPDKPIRSSIEETRAGLGELKYNIAEVDTIKKLFNADVYSAERATKDAFLENAGQYKIIHLSTHGKANDQQGDYSYLAFSKEPQDSFHKLLYNRELYFMSIEADMVVLSACETGIGDLKKGEGIISMARGFSYAGTRSIITSLWSVDDKKTKELMTSFYKNIKSGMEKDKALRLAKLDFIDNHTVDAHPFYWSAFIPIGEMAPIKLDSKMTWEVWCILLCVFLGIFFIVKNNRT